MRLEQLNLPSGIIGNEKIQTEIQTLFNPYLPCDLARWTPSRQTDSTGKQMLRFDIRAADNTTDSYERLCLHPQTKTIERFAASAKTCESGLEIFRDSTQLSIGAIHYLFEKPAYFIDTVDRQIECMITPFRKFNPFEETPYFYVMKSIEVIVRQCKIRHRPINKQNIVIEYFSSQDQEEIGIELSEENMVITSVKDRPPILISHKTPVNTVSRETDKELMTLFTNEVSPCFLDFWEKPISTPPDTLAPFLVQFAIEQLQAASEIEPS
jgi:hypothetical protein